MSNRKTIFHLNIVFIKKKKQKKKQTKKHANESYTNLSYFILNIFYKLRNLPFEFLWPPDNMTKDGRTTCLVVCIVNS